MAETVEKRTGKEEAGEKGRRDRPKDAQDTESSGHPEWQGAGGKGNGKGRGGRGTSAGGRGHMGEGGLG